MFLSRYCSWYFSWLMPSFLGAVLGGVAAGALGLAGSIFGANKAASAQDAANQANLQSTREQIEFQRESNQQAMDFSERMAGSQYQRGTQDMRAAGLNPMLAVQQGGAAAPQGVSSAGAAARVEPTFSPQTFNSAIGALQSMVQLREAVARTENVEADTSNKDKVGQNIDAQTGLIRLQQGTEGYRPAEIVERTGEHKARRASLEARLQPDIEKIRSDIRLNEASAEQIRSQNLMTKTLMNDPNLAPIAPLLQFIFRR